MRAGLAILQQMSPGGSIQQRRCDTNKRQNSNATTQQSTVRRRRSIEGCSRSDCTTAQSLAQVGCCLGAVNVIDCIMVDVSIDSVMFDGFRGASMRCGEDLLVDEKVELRGRACHLGVTNLLGYFTEVRKLATSAQNICQRRQIILCSKTVELRKTIMVSTCTYLKHNFK